jgi:2-oxoglutarate dehydrogenase E2 component (dihydrolipoamide succinyltransferase)
MPTDIKMPQLGESVTEGTVARWLKQAGDAVEQYEPLLEVTTDKVDTEVPAPSSGTLTEILVPEGTTVRVGTVIARLAPAGEPATAQSEGPRAEPAPQATTPRPAAHAPGEEPDEPAPVSPVVARLAAEHRLDLAAIPGTGRGGRVSKQDVLRYLETRAQPAASVAPPEGQRAATALERTPAAPPQPSQPSQPPGVPAGEITLVPLTPMRRSIAEHMTRSVQTAPHVTTIFEVDMGRVAAHRAQARRDFERQGARLTYSAYFAQAVAAGLLAVPVLNGRYTEQGIAINQRVHLGLAVALDDGLLVPVIRDADEKSLLGLARAIGDLSERARTRRLTPDETQGGTFTVTNHGTGGSIIGTPIINQPQSGILGVGAIVKRAVVVEHDGGDTIAIRPMCYLALTFDHRVCDGATADTFLAEVKRYLESYA